jgi:hypothetical protein
MSEEDDREEDRRQKSSSQSRFPRLFRRHNPDDQQGKEESRRDWRSPGSLAEAPVQKPAFRRPSQNQRGGYSPYRNYQQPNERSTSGQYRRYGNDDEVGSRFGDDWSSNQANAYEPTSEPAERTLRRKGEVKPPPDLHLPAGMLQCDICKALVPRTRLQEHMSSRHTEQPDVAMEACPNCKALVRADRLERHLRKVHPDDFR